MLLDVVYPVFNRVDTVEESILCLLQIRCLNKILIADGGSTDGTWDVLMKLSKFHTQLKIVSRSDDGLYHGANIALRQVEAKYFMFMNSDDCAVSSYYDTAVQLLEYSNIDYVYGDIRLGNNRKVPPSRFKRFLFGAYLMPFPHVSLVCNTRIIELVGEYNQNYSVVGDLDWLNRALKLRNRGFYLQSVSAHCRDGGLSSSSGHHAERDDQAIKNGANLFNRLCMKFLT